MISMGRNNTKQTNKGQKQPSCETEGHFVNSVRSAYCALARTNRGLGAKCRVDKMSFCGGLADPK